MYLTLKQYLRTLFLRLLLKTGTLFYVVIRATRRSIRFQGKGCTFILSVTSVLPVIVVVVVAVLMSCCFVLFCFFLVSITTELTELPAARLTLYSKY